MTMPEKGTPAGTLHVLKSRDGTEKTFEWTGDSWSTPGTGWGTKWSAMQALGWSYVRRADYEKAKELGLTAKDRWSEGIDHHPESVRLMGFLEHHDMNDYGMYFDWSTGGDGDNGETLMFQMDAYFELRDKLKA